MDGSGVGLFWEGDEAVVGVVGFVEDVDPCLGVGHGGSLLS
jgi:hypothetical protein